MNGFVTDATRNRVSGSQPTVATDSVVADRRADGERGHRPTRSAAASHVS